MKTFSKVMKFIGIAQMTLGIAGMLSCIVGGVIYATRC